MNTVLVNLDGRQINVVIEGGGLGPASSVAVAEAVAAAAAAEASAAEAEAAAIEAAGVISTRAKLDGSNFTGSQPEQFRAAIGAVGLVALAADDGGDLIGTIQSGTGAVAMTQGLRNSESVSVLDFVPANLRAAIRAGTSTTDVTTYIQAAFDAHLRVVFPDGFYKITAQLTPRAGQTVILSPGVTIQQFTIDTTIFYALQKDSLTFLCNNALLKGQGFWSGSWTGGSGHFDIAFQLVDCDNFLIDRPHIRNCGLAGIKLDGGTGGRIVEPVIEGTNAYSTVIPYLANNQFGIYLLASPTYGAPNRLTIIAPDISGTAMGILSELTSAGAQPATPPLVMGANIHDITGQHAFYCQFALTIVGASVTDIALAGVKFQSTSDQNQDVRGFMAVGIVGRDLGSSLFEITQIDGTADLTGIELEGVGVDVAIGLSTGGRVSGRAAINIDGCDSFAVMQGAGSNFDMAVRGDGCDSDGFVITATTSTFNIRPDVKNVTRVAGDASTAGFNIASASAVVNIYDPKIAGASGSYMKYAITNKVAGTTVTVHGQPTVSAAATATLLETAPIKYSDWRSWTPTYSSTGGSLTTMTTNTGRYIHLTPTTIAFELDVTFTDVGTATGDFFVTLPVTATSAFAFSGFDNLTTGVNIVCRVRPADLTKMSIVTQVNAAAFAAGASLEPGNTMATGRRIVMSGTYSVA